MKNLNFKLFKTNFKELIVARGWSWKIAFFPAHQNRLILQTPTISIVGFIFRRYYEKFKRIYTSMETN